MLRAFDRRRPISAVAVLALLLAGSIRLEGANLYNPALRFRTIRTDHFFIHFHQGEDRMAARLAAIAEDVWPSVGQALGFPAPRTTHVVLADQSEMANGWATPVPYNTIFVTAAAPPGSDFIGRNDDWLRLVFTHEFTHIVHLGRSEGWARVFRGIFGRMPIAFPNLWLPTWQVEGLAAWEESAITGEGRLYAGDFRAIEREAARGRRLEPLDRVNGGLTDWPGGLAPYAFGLGFHDYLANRFGEARFGELARKTSRSVPFFSSRAFKAVYGQSLGTLWRDYRQNLSNSESVSNSSNRPSLSNRPNTSNLPNLSNPVTRLTTDGYSVLGPRFAPGDCQGCPSEIVYTAQNPNGFPALNMTTVAASPPRWLANRYLGSTVAVSRNLLVFDQQELHRNAALYSDLYVFDRQTKDVHRLTDGQRLQDPDFSPDGQSIVCVRQKAGVGELVLVRLPKDRRTSVTGEALVSEVDIQFAAPRWSPDGRSIAVEQHRLGRRSEIAVVDVATGVRRVVAADADARIVTPAWRPDGRALVVAADFDGDTFNLYEFDLADEQAPPRQLTRVSGGATWPDISSDGGAIAFVGYTVDGFDVFLTPYPDASTSPVMPSRQSTPADRNNDDVAMPPHAPYSPWSTLRPTSWTPIVEGDSDVWAGVATSGFDVLGRHAYAASAVWLVAAPDDALTPSTSSPDWNVSYAYDRWQPTIFASASRTTTFFAGPADASGRPEPATLRETGAEVGVLFPIRHVRANYRALTSFVRTLDRVALLDDVVAIRHSAWRAGTAVNTARLYGYSISREEGASVGATAELAWRESGPEHANAFTVDGRAYLGGLARHHVVALRASGGRATGDAVFSRTFLLGGPGPNADVLDFGREAFSLLRGFRPRAFAGTHVALFNADYRFPLARPQRGVGTWPLFLHTVHAAVFTDVGNAWVDRLRARDAKSSLGAELSLDLVAGYSFPFTTTIGGAWGHDGADRRDGSVLYFRIGRAF